ncbi:MAG TPA: isoaspartyl peptidase/L-asparaginase [Polyangiaceae bacterium LLY-WYZ-14_1]|nr:isoaspartyl peptidase/L-asparaginase [Polyangiaceae bacterium LLY-WYZ-14_1]
MTDDDADDAPKGPGAPPGGEASAWTPPTFPAPTLVEAPVLLVHGGAGETPLDRRPAQAEGCRGAAEAGARVLAAGGSALDAVVAAVAALEEDPAFNAGRGASLNAEGAVELDACVMEGAQRRAGAVAALPPFESAIRVARAVLDDGQHVLLAGEGAARFAEAQGFPRLAPDALTTEQARARLERFRRGEVGGTWAGGAGDTVGAVALDGRGGVASATSTGGTVGKQPGRVGDSPIPGAGAWAEDGVGACSTTGVGETILRSALALRAVDLLRAGVPAPEAAWAAVAAFGRAPVRGAGGLILVDARGRVGMAWNTATMSHALVRPTDL